MHIKTILNRVQKFKSFVYESERWVENAAEPTIEVALRARTNSQAICSGCGQCMPGYDTLPVRRFEFIPFWGIKVHFVYQPRRVQCKACDRVVVEQMPWVQGKHQLTEAYAWYLARWAKRLSWKEVAQAFRTSWDQVFSAVEMAVTYGLAQRDLSGIEALGIDEIAWKRGHKYLTLTYQIDAHCKRLLWIGQERKESTLDEFFGWLGKERTGKLRFICSDMWKPYLTVIEKHASQALHILDRFHIMATLNKAIDEVRAQEARVLQQQGFEAVLKKSRWAFLKRPENLTDKQQSKLVDLLKYNLKTVKSYLLKEEFQQFWGYLSPHWAGRFLDQWCTKTMRSRIEPMKKVARQLRKHRHLLMNWFKAKGLYSSGIVEGFNNKAKLTSRKSYGFRTFHATEMALYHALGALPVPKTAHEFF